jgi:hypothetical protein
MTATAAHPPLDVSRLQALHRAALDHLPPEQRDLAAKFPVMQELGYGEMEIARLNGVTWKQLDNLRRDLQGAFVKALESDGYTDAEIARYLGIPTRSVTCHTHEPTCHRGMSGELEAQCQCKAIRARRGEHQEDDGPDEHASGRVW